MTYEAEQFHVAAAIEGVGIVWEETLPAAEVAPMLDALRSADPGRNVIAENGYDVSALTITVRAVALSDFDKACQDELRERRAAADLDAQEEAERAARRAQNVAAAERELEAAGISFTLTSADTHGTVWSPEDRVLGTVRRPGRGETRWTFHTPDGALAWTTPGRLTMLRRILRRFA